MPRQAPAQDRSQIEHEAHRAFKGMEIRSESELIAAITPLFSVICGDSGKEEFFSVTLPTAIKIYGTNYRSAGVRLLEIIDAGSSLKASETGAYFAKAISPSEIAFSENKEGIPQEIERTIQDVIEAKKEAFGEAYEGVLAVVIYGSMAKGNFTKNSDIDVIYISKTEDKEAPLEDEYISYSDDFERSLQRELRARRLNFPLQNTFGTFGIDDKSIFNDMVGEGFSLEQNHIIVTPYPEIKARLERLLEEEVKKLAP